MKALPQVSNASGVQYVHLSGGYMLLSDAKNVRKDFIRTEPAELGN